MFVLNNVLDIQVSCDMEDGKTCGYKNDTGNSLFNWVPHRGPANDPNSGPTTDHTTGKSKGKSCEVDNCNYNYFSFRLCECENIFNLTSKNTPT